MADITIYKPAPVTVVVIDGDPPVDQSAEVAALQAQVAALTQQIQQVSKIATAPRELVRDPKTGRPVGSRIVVE